MTAISGNFGAFNAVYHLQRADEAQGRIGERLSSGERFSRTAEAPADFATSTQIRSEIKAMRQLRQSSYDGVNFIQIADNTLGEVYNQLTRAMELAEWSASDAVGGDNGNAKQARNTEYQDILAALDHLNDDPRFNEQQVFGTGSSFNVNMGFDPANTSDQITITTQPVSSTALALAGTDILTTANSNVVLTNLRAALDTVTRQRAVLGTNQNRIERNIDGLNDQIDNNFTRDSQIRDTDIATEAVRLTSLQIQSQSNLAAIAQANLSSESVLQLLG